jgi:hypothetical protein
MDERRLLNLENLIAFRGTATGDGAAGGNTVVCGDLAAVPDYNSLTLVIVNGSYKGQASAISGSTTGGTATVITPFGGQITSGTEFVILSLIAPKTDTEALDFALADSDDFDVPDADASNERWDSGYIAGAAGGSADIDTTTADKLMIAVDPSGGPATARYGTWHLLPIYADYFRVIVDLSCTWGATDSATPKAAGIIFSAGDGAFDANNFLAIERQKGTSINRIQVRGTLNSVALTATNVDTTDDAVAFKVERWDETWRFYYSTTQYPSYVWILAAQIEDSSNYMTNQSRFFQQVYTPGTAVAESVVGDFGHFRFLIAAGVGGGQFIVGDYNSAWVTSNRDGNVMERTEFLMNFATQLGGLAFMGVVSAQEAGSETSVFYSAELAGLGLVDDYLKTHYWAFVLKAGGASPESEVRAITAYTGATGKITVSPVFGAAIEVGDELLIVHESLIAPAADVTTTRVPSQVIGNKADAIPAMNAAPAATTSLVAITKAIMERVGATPADPDDSLLTINGQRDDAAPAMNVAPADTDTLVMHLKAIRETVGQEPADADDSLHTIHGQRDDAAPAMSAAPTDTDTVAKHLKALRETVGQTPADPDDSVLTNLGQRDSAATNDDMSDVTATSIEAKLRLILNRLSTDAFTATIQGAARTALDTMLGQLATYLSASGAAMSIQVNNQTARTDLEEALEDFFTVFGCDGVNTFDPAMFGGAQTTLEAAFTALGTALGAEFDGTPNVYDVLVTGHDSSGITANEDGSVEERLEYIQGQIALGSLEIEDDTGGSTTNIPDASVITHAADYWKGCLLLCTDGANVGQARPIVNSAVGSVDVYPGFTSVSVLGDTYLIVSAYNKAVWVSQPDVPVTINAILASETNVFDLSTAGLSYLVNSLRLKCADPGANTVYVRLYELINDVQTLVATFNITTTNYGTYFSLVDMFGQQQLAGDDLMVTVQASAGGPYAVTGQYHYSMSYSG